MGEPLPHEILQIRFGSFALQHNGSTNPLSSGLAGDAKSHHLDNSRMLHEYSIDFGRRYLFSTDVDKLLQSPRNSDPAVRIANALVAGA